MKNLYSFLAFFALFIVGCNEEEIKQQENSIYGQWSLIKYEAGFSPTRNFNVGEISWIFKSTNNLQVQVIDSTINPPLLKTNEVYNFSINNDRILINDVEYDFSIDESTLIISDKPSSDGFRVTCTKKTK